MIPVKSEEEIELMRQSGRILKAGIEKLGELARPGVLTEEFDIAFNKFCFKNKVKPTFKNYKEGGVGKGYPASLCVSVNDEVVHGIPGKRILKDGDIVTLDAGVTYQGFITDMAVTLPIGIMTKETEKLIKVTQDSLYKAIGAVKEGARVGDISAEIYSHVKKEGLNVFPSLAGHGVGRELHEEPLIPNIGLKGKGEVLKTGMTLAIETMISLGGEDLLLAPDNWTLKSADGAFTAQFEHTVLVTKESFEILTR